MAQEVKDDSGSQARPRRVEGAGRPEVERVLHARPRPESGQRRPEHGCGVPELRRPAPRPGALPAGDGRGAAGGRLLDLMSSWRSHLPEGARYGEVVGLGMNADEMAENPQLTRSVVHDLNRDPRLPFADGEFDAAMCAVSIQYVTNPPALFREMSRVLRPGAPFVVSFSNRCFPTKAVAVWLGTDDLQHVALVRAYFEAAGPWAEITEEARWPSEDGDPLYAVWAR